MRIIIIGGVAAGMSAAAKLKRLKPEYEVVVYEKSDVVSFGACGLPYFVGGFFDESSNMISRSVEKFIESGIDLKVFHEVIGVDDKLKRIQVEDIKTGNIFEDSYDKLMIATGASSIIPPIKNINLKNISTLKSMEDGIKVKNILKNETIQKVVIIGAGFIGIEFVEAAKKLGKEVVIVQATDRILDQVFDKEITDILEDEIRSQNVELRVEELATEFIGTDKVEAVITNKGKIEANLVIIATGVKPNTSFLKNTNIDMLANGAIVVDEYGKTSVEDIYSAGDCATIKNLITNDDMFVPLATGANKLGRIVGENLAGCNKSFQGSLASSCIKVMYIEAATTGMTEQKARNMGINYKTKFISDFNQTNYYPGRGKIHVKIVYDKESKRILGGQVVGTKDSVQRVNVLAAAIFGKMTTTQLGMLDLCYAPPFSRTWDVLNVVGNVSK